MQLRECQTMQMTLTKSLKQCQKETSAPRVKQIHFKGQTHKKSLDNKVIKMSG